MHKMFKEKYIFNKTFKTKKNWKKIQILHSIIIEIYGDFWKFFKGSRDFLLVPIVSF